MKVFLAPPPFSIWLPGCCHCCSSVFSARLHEGFSWNTVWELQEVKLRMLFRGLISEKGNGSRVPLPTESSCSLHRWWLHRGFGWEQGLYSYRSVSFQAAMWDFCQNPFKCAIALFGFLLSFWFGQSDCSYSLKPRRTLSLVYLGSAWVCLDCIAGWVTGQMAGLCLGLFCAFVSFWWASVPSSGCYE